MAFEVVVGVAIGLALLWVGLLALFFVFRPKGVPIREILALIPDVLRLLRSLVGDRSVPLDVRIVLVGLVAWILSPIDLIPSSSRCSGRSTTWSWRSSPCATSDGGWVSPTSSAAGPGAPTASCC